MEGESRDIFLLLFIMCRFGPFDLLYLCVWSNSQIFQMWTFKSESSMAQRGARISQLFSKLVIENRCIDSFECNLWPRRVTRPNSPSVRVKNNFQKFSIFAFGAAEHTVSVN